MTAQTIKIGIPGAAGRMGRMLIREIDAAPDLKLVAASDRAGTDAIGQNSGLLAGTGSNQRTGQCTGKGKMCKKQNVVGRDQGKHAKCSNPWKKG